MVFSEIRWPDRQNYKSIISCVQPGWNNVILLVAIPSCEAIAIGSSNHRAGDVYKVKTSHYQWQKSWQKSNALKSTFLSLNKVKMESADYPLAVVSKGHMLTANNNVIYSDTKIEESCIVVTSMELDNESHADWAVQKKSQRRPKTNMIKERNMKEEFLEARLRSWINQHALKNSLRCGREAW